MDLHEDRNTAETTGRLLARLVRTLLTREPFETLADLTEALKVECGRLKIRWTNDDISAAYRLIESNHPLPGAPRRRAPNQRHVERLDDARPLSRDEAADLYARLLGAVRREHLTGRARA